MIPRARAATNTSCAFWYSEGAFLRLPLAVHCYHTS
jgi:hypothetical protein